MKSQYEIIEIDTAGKEHTICNEFTHPTDLCKAVWLYAAHGLRSGVVKVRGREIATGIWVCEVTTEG